MPSDIPRAVHGDELPGSGSRFTISVDAEHIEKMLHKGTRGKFEVYSDEPDGMGGDDNYPAPLTYIAMGIGF